jgi:hypothetical protein
VGPGVREALNAVGVRVLRRGEAALGQTQVAQHVLERLLGDFAVALVAGHEPAVQVGGHEEGVVVEHLLEVRHEPALVHRITVKAAGDEVVHAAGCHPVEGLRDHLRLAPAEEQLER